jgi:hypothetical protein
MQEPLKQRLSQLNRIVVNLLPDRQPTAAGRQNCDGLGSAETPDASFLISALSSQANLLTSMTSVTERLAGTDKYLFRFRINQKQGQVLPCSR